mmetsp:Transcript_11741/g.36326  ORF Transcript_11741/g.36326 Transcript_11741/m.36326 type:complete len:216 (+) Transcript_11741:1316-1963(+)
MISAPSATEPRSKHERARSCRPPKRKRLATSSAPAAAKLSASASVSRSCARASSPCHAQDGARLSSAALPMPCCTSTSGVKSLACAFARCAGRSSPRARAAASLPLPASAASSTSPSNGCTPTVVASFRAACSMSRTRPVGTSARRRACASGCDCAASVDARSHSPFSIICSSLRILASSSSPPISSCFAAESLASLRASLSALLILAPRRRRGL